MIAYALAVGYFVGLVVVGATPLLLGLVVPVALGTEWFLDARGALCGWLGVGPASEGTPRAEPLVRCSGSGAGRRRELTLTLAGLAAGASVTGVAALALWLA